MTPYLQHLRTQWPVGQGFFHHGELRGYDESGESWKFAYIYDCGSTSQTHADREVRRYLTDEPNELDVLFLSHLDTDHVCGLDKLLASVGVHTVVLPYLSTIDRITLAVNAADGNQLTSDYISLVGDPLAWFVARNVKRVIFVQRGGQQNLFVRDEPPGTGPSPRTPRRGVTLEEKHLHPHHITTAEKEFESDVEVLVISHTTPLELVDPHGDHIGWCFRPFVHPDPDRQARLRSSVNRQFPELRVEGRKRPAPITQPLLAILQDRNKRRILFNSYSGSWSDVNHSSMSLYSGPTLDSNHICSRVGWQDNVKCGWIATGDADLANQSRRDAFVAHYLDYRPLTSTMCLPHHGSVRSFDESILFPTADVYVIAARQNSRHHPGIAVMSALHRYDLQYVICTEDTMDGFREHFTLILPS